VTVTSPPEEPTRRQHRHIPAPKRRQPAPPAAFGWRWVYPLLLAGLGVAVYVLAVSGARAVLDTSGGLTIEPVTDPSLPGYEVLVAPTEVLLVATVDDADELVGVTVLVPTAGQQGGTIVTVPASLAVALDDGSAPFSLDAVFAEGGIDLLAERMAQVLGVGTTEVEVVDPLGLERMLDPLGELRLTLPDALVEEAPDGTLRTLIPAGASDLDPDEIVEVFSHVNPGESPVNRIGRQVHVWEAWLEALADGGSLPELTVPLTEVLGGMVGGTVVQERLPFQQITVPLEGGGGLPLLAADLAEARALGLRMVPFPVDAASVPRVPVRLMNGTASLSLDRVVTEFGSQLVAAGARVVVIGNADPMDRPASEIRTTEAGAEAAQRLADALGITTVTVTTNHPTIADLTVIVGEDLAGG